VVSVYRRVNLLGFPTEKDKEEEEEEERDKKCCGLGSFPRVTVA